jgi:hypothetical protein
VRLSEGCLHELKYPEEDPAFISDGKSVEDIGTYFIVESQ